MSRRRLCRKTAVLLFLSVSQVQVTMADAVLEWNEIGVAAVHAARQTPPEGARSLALMHLAMFEAVNAIEQRYRSHAAVARHAGAGASGEIAAAAAAHRVLVTLFAEQREQLDKAYAEALARREGGPGGESGAAAGEAAASRCLALRENDGAGAENRYVPHACPGVYVPTTLPVSWDWRVVTPWFGKTSAELRPEPPPALTSARWARDYDEIKRLGSQHSQHRTAEQTEAARFWTAVGPATWNPIVRSLAASRPRSVIQNARLFALVNMAAMDSFVAVFDAKYAFHFWRPVTAIRNGAIDGNDATVPDPTWVPLVDTPLHPEYPCAHCASAGAVGAVLEAEFGTGPVGTITMTSPTAPGVTHRWERIADYVREVNNARIWGGVHYRTSTEVGERLGREIGRRAASSLPAIDVGDRGGQ